MVLGCSIDPTTQHGKWLILQEKYYAAREEHTHITRIFAKFTCLSSYSQPVNETRKWLPLYVFRLVLWVSKFDFDTWKKMMIHGCSIDPTTQPSKHPQKGRIVICRRFGLLVVASVINEIVICVGATDHCPNQQIGVARFAAEPSAVAASATNEGRIHFNGDYGRRSVMYMSRVVPSISNHVARSSWVVAKDVIHLS